MNRSICVALTLVCLSLVGCGGGGGGSTKGGGGSGGTGGSGGSPSDMGTIKNPSNDMAETASSDMANHPADMAPVQIVGADKCNAAVVIPLDQPSIDLVGNTTKATHDLSACAGTSGADVFYSFTLHEKELVYADTFGATWDTALFFASSCTTPLPSGTTPGDAVCNDDACTKTQSQVVALLMPGTYYLVLSGKATGSATVHFQHASVGRGPLTLLPKGASTQSGTTSGNGSSFDCEAAGAENSYWWLSCPSDGKGTFSGSLCGGADFDTIAYLQTPATKNEICADDSCGVQSSIMATIPAAAGVNVFTVDGQSGVSNGAYTVTFSRP